MFKYEEASELIRLMPKQNATYMQKTFKEWQQKQAETTDVNDTPPIRTLGHCCSILYKYLLHRPLTNMYN